MLGGLVDTALLCFKENPLNYDIMLTFACGEERNVKPFAVIAPVGLSGSCTSQGRSFAMWASSQALGGRPLSHHCSLT